jgi:hypothetical protein
VTDAIPIEDVLIEPPIESEPDPTRANVRHLAYVGSSPNARDANSWFTPSIYIEAARHSLGGTINLDPFSSAVANEVVQADLFYDEAADAFSQDWGTGSKGGTIFMNPPYSAGLAARAVMRMLDEYEAGTFTQGVFLVNNATETKWFQRALGVAAAFCLTDHRISFWDEQGKSRSGNTRGQAFVYLGHRPWAFMDAFSEHGTTVLLRHPRRTVTRRKDTLG